MYALELACQVVEVCKVACSCNGIVVRHLLCGDDNADILLQSRLINHVPKLGSMGQKHTASGVCTVQVLDQAATVPNIESYSQSI